MVIGMVGESGVRAEPLAGQTLPANTPLRWRAPSALWLAADGTTLIAACEKSGTLAVIDTVERRLVSEISIGKAVAALAGSPDGSILVACDDIANQLILLDRSGQDISVRARVPLPPKPVRVALDPAGKTAFVSSSWSRQLSRVDISTAQVSAAIPLGFAPRECTFLVPGRTLIVADAFGGQFALVDAAEARVVRQLEIPGHNIRGLALSPDTKHLLVSQMILTESAGTTRDNVFWGILMTSNLRVIPVAALLDASRTPIRETHTHFLGDPGHGAGDPNTVVTTSDGTTIVCLGGVGEVTVGRYQPHGFRRVSVGKRPVAVAVAPDERRAYVANHHADSISIIDLQERLNLGEISLAHLVAPDGADTLAVQDPGAGAGRRQSPPTVQLSWAEQGERLFYDARLSLDGWYSCHSCHTDGHTNGQNADTMGDGTYGAPKSVLSLLGTGLTDPWAWNGSKRALEDQVRESLRQTMQPKSPPGERAVAAIHAYLQSLAPAPVTSWQQADTAAIHRGSKIFRERGCTNCHAPPLYTNEYVYDVGLDDGEGGNRRFNPPSLRGVAHTAPYFHDGRAKNLEAVFREFRHRLRSDLPESELQDLTAFLRSL
jgi:cytochrome c peroxidase